MCSVPTVYSGPTSFMCSASQALLDYCVVPTIPDCYATVIYIYIYIYIYDRMNTRLEY